jgi:copper chaperone CopZ
MHEAKIKVNGMNCQHCKISVENNLKKISGIQIVVADVINHEVWLKGEDIDLDKVKDTLENIGYSYAGKLA